MSRSELTLAIAAALVAAMLVGWVLRWMFGRMNAGPRSVALTADMAARLHAAEDGRARAESRLAEVEAELGRRLDEAQAELAAAVDGRARAEAQAEEIRDAYRRALLLQGSGRG
jgi:hypothetical protein